MTSWLFVLGDRDAIDWVVEHEVMGFRKHINADRLGPTDRCAFYVTRGAFHNPARDISRVFAVGRLTGPVQRRGVEIAGEEFALTVPFAFDRLPLPARQGMPFAPLIADLDFIVKKESWPGYLRQALVKMSDRDMKTIDSALKSFEKTTSKA